jgi:hypothetical protein
LKQFKPECSKLRCFVLTHARLDDSEAQQPKLHAGSLIPLKPCYAMGFLAGHELTWMPEALRILRDELPQRLRRECNRKGGGFCSRTKQGKIRENDTMSQAACKIHMRVPSTHLSLPNFPRCN